jgi:hypothetical protein
MTLGQSQCTERSEFLSQEVEIHIVFGNASASTAYEGAVRGLTGTVWLSALVKQRQKATESHSTRTKTPGLKTDTVSVCEKLAAAGVLNTTLPSHYNYESGSWAEDCKPNKHIRHGQKATCMAQSFTDRYTWCIAE